MPVQILEIPYIEKKTTTTKIDKFELTGVFLQPDQKKATIYIKLVDTNNIEYERNFQLTSEEYELYTTDQFLFDLITSRIEQLFHNK